MIGRGKNNELYAIYMGYRGTLIVGPTRGKINNMHAIEAIALQVVSEPVKSPARRGGAIIRPCPATIGWNVG